MGFIKEVLGDFIFGFTPRNSQSYLLICCVCVCVRALIKSHQDMQGHVPECIVSGKRLVSCCSAALRHPSFTTTQMLGPAARPTFDKPRARSTKPFSNTGVREPHS